MNKNKIIIDTDPGKDDALAIMLLSQSKLFSIEAVTTVAGNVSIQNTTDNTRFILNLLECESPVYSGSSKPMKKKLITANVHGKTGLDGVFVNKNTNLSGNAVDKIIEIVNKYPKKITIVALGPLTNIAIALKKDPSIAKKIKQIVIMGGAINVPGNKSSVAEFNIFVDPDAANIVFNSKANIVLVPLDVCNKTPLFMNDFQKITGYLKIPIVKLMKNYIKSIKKFDGQKGAIVYDALAAYYLINKNAFSQNKADIKIETKGILTSGMTVMEKRNNITKSYNINLVTNVDKSIFAKDFINIISKQ